MIRCLGRWNIRILGAGYGLVNIALQDLPDIFDDIGIFPTGGVQPKRHAHECTTK